MFLFFVAPCHKRGSGICLFGVMACCQVDLLCERVHTPVVSLTLSLFTGPSAFKEDEARRGNLGGNLGGKLGPNPFMVGAKQVEFSSVFYYSSLEIEISCH